MTTCDRCGRRCHGPTHPCGPQLCPCGKRTDWADLAWSAFGGVWFTSVLIISYYLPDLVR